MINHERILQQEIVYEGYIENMNWEINWEAVDENKQVWLLFPLETITIHDRPKKEINKEQGDRNEYG